MEHRESNMISGEGLPTYVALVEMQQIGLSLAGRGLGDSVLGLSPPCTLCSAALPHSVQGGESKPKRVRKLGCYSLYQSASRGTERWRRAEN